MVDRVADIEAAFERHWRHFGGYPGASLRDEDGVLWFESPIRRLPYNWVIRTRIPAAEHADNVIARVAGTFRARDVPFMWVQRPSDTPSDLGRRLAAHGLDLVETATGMDLDLNGWIGEPNASGARLVQVDTPDADPQGLSDYEELIRTYWSVPEAERNMIETLNRHWTGQRNPGFRLVAYLNDRPVGKLFANLEDLPDWIAIYGVAVKPEARGRGVATALMNEAIARGKQAGARRCILHSSSMARAMYGRMGFVERCELPVFATEGLFGTHHH
ncbi:MAG: GNAT family N-acetyltransferase [Chloroflexota bacterium]|nr:GNAT family N-acetyltransferase [Chloroflexota bacterium]